ncbi:sensor histidine kinase [Ruminococcus albus]|uniref:histidine kinase n=1 Tax=Ruminococcus albus 8 TaxID=246199 RepID=E9SCV5_RUMAL|nr:HAMP domain-containing sensor histidine kinase [Ruminococcus albus]EGC02870.1 ATPase/histidine kinase/DNA gyrase B/HSP90 domain protein [Ruminococcus albus 8]MCC3352470.1 HAMP domain-containing histidine kinase [Ruminococcus albus 8]
MIKRLQRRFILIAALSVLIVELVVVGSINAINIRQINKRETQIMQILCENDGDFPDFMRREQKSIKPDNRYGDVNNSAGQNAPPPSPNQDMKRNDSFGLKLNEETRYQTRYFYVRYDRDLKPVRVNTGHIAAVSSYEALEYAERVNAEKKTSGFADNYRYAVKDTADGGVLYIFLDCRDGIQTKQNFILVSAAISLGGWMLICVLIMVLSKMAVKPFIDNYEKQRMFITDAGHEIKTPLAIISANTEVIEMISEPSEWTESIKNQIERLNGLIANLLKLARMDEDAVKLTFEEFSLTDAFIDIAEPFKTLAANKGLSLEIEAQEGIRVNGDEGALRQLVSILTENAVKYCDKDGSIKAVLTKSGSGRHAVISVENDCKEPPSHPERLFDRFYRADSSRKRDDGEKKTGYGIGLSVAKATVDAHKGKIDCKTENGRIIFRAKLKMV